MYSYYSIRLYDTAIWYLIIRRIKYYPRYLEEGMVCCLLGESTNIVYGMVYYMTCSLRIFGSTVNANQPRLIQLHEFSNKRFQMINLLVPALKPMFVKRSPVAHLDFQIVVAFS
jgi:hypothetical protein